MAQGREEKKIPVMKMSGLGVSIKRPHIEQEQRNPSSNPTGSVYSKEELAGLAAVLAKYPQVVVIADEISVSYTHLDVYKRQAE